MLCKLDVVLRGHVRMFLWRKAEVVFALCVVVFNSRSIGHFFGF